MGEAGSPCAFLALKKAGDAVLKRSKISLLTVVLLLSTPVKAATPELFAAIKAGQYNTVRFLLHLDPKMLEARSMRGIRPLHCAVAEGNVLIVHMLLDEGADVNAQCFDGTTPLMKAAETGQLEVLFELDVPNLDVNIKDKRGHTALHYAAESGCCEMVEFLLQRGADVNARTDQGTMPLSLAIVNNYTEAATLIRARGGIE